MNLAGTHIWRSKIMDMEFGKTDHILWNLCINNYQIESTIQDHKVFQQKEITEKKSSIQIRGEREREREIRQNKKSETSIKEKLKEKYTEERREEKNYICDQPFCHRLRWVIKLKRV